MTRTSKQEKRRAISPKRPKLSGPKTGKKKDKLLKGFKEHINAVEGTSQAFIPKVK